LLAAGVAVPRRLTQCRILVAYKNRLVAMNTYERAAGGASYVAYQNRIRFSQAGTPLTEGAIGVGPAFAWTTVSAWAEDVPGKGGYIDLPTSEQIVTAEFIKDTLLVKCERSSYKLIYTGIPSTPFIYEKINTELGAESTFSKIPFDNGVLTVGNNGVTVDDSISVVRIDRKIPDFAFAIHNAQEGVKRVHGIRDYFYELALWTYPSISTQAHFPDKILVYNYKNQSFAEFNDSFTCFGYYQRLLDLTWADLPYLTWSDWSITWKSGKAQSKFPDIIGGNQQGYVSVLSQQGLNGISLSLKAIDGTVSPTELTIPNHNLQTGMFIKITDVISDAGPPDYAAYFNNQIFKVVRVDQDRISLFFSPDPFDVVDLGVGGTYIGCGHVSVINNFNVTTKMFAPFYEQGGQARLGHVDFLLQTTSDGELSSNILIDECDSVSLTDPTSTDGNLGTFVLLTQPENTTLIPFQAGQDKIWHRQYVQAICQNFQIQLSMNDTQMFFENIAASDFVLHALVLYVSKNARLVQ
jgi:hypothetical protein